MFCLLGSFHYTKKNTRISTKEKLTRTKKKKKSRDIWLKGKPAWIASATTQLKVEAWEPFETSQIVLWLLLENLPL